QHACRNTAFSVQNQCSGDGLRWHVVGKVEEHFAIAAFDGRVVDVEGAFKCGGGVGAVAHIDTQEGHVVSKFLTEIGQFGGFNPAGGARSVAEVHECRTVNIVGSDGVAVEGCHGKIDGFGKMIHVKFND